MQNPDRTKASGIYHRFLSESIIFPVIYTIRENITVRVYPLPCWDCTNRGSENATRIAARNEATEDFKRCLPANQVKGIANTPAIVEGRRKLISFSPKIPIEIFEKKENNECWLGPLYWENKVSHDEAVCSQKVVASSPERGTPRPGKRIATATPINTIRKM